MRGKFLCVGDETFAVRGVTYGPFRPRPDGSEYLDAPQVQVDFAAMAAAGFNTVRTYTVPPRWLLDVAHANRLRVMVGVAWEQHVTFLGDSARARAIVERVRSGVRVCAGHPALLSIAIGNEIPAPIVRWHGPNAIARFLRRLYDAVKLEDPGVLVTYVSYPTTEYLELPFLDFVSFNVFLEKREQLAGYLARLQNLADDRPLVLTEVGLDSQRNSEEGQAQTIGWQIDVALRGGCAGVFVFAWTDEWFRGGHEIEDWSFGLTDRDRVPKLALDAARTALSRPLLESADAPRISVVVCTYNGERTIRECLEGLSRLDYPDYEVVVVNDGSTDGTAAIVGEFDVVRIDTQNGGLSSARNVGMRAATGEIVAYLDDDAYPDPTWLTFLALAFLGSDHVGIGGPNVPPPDDCIVADCVANAPGGPSHVLHTDSLAEHLPGCNMAFRRDALLAIDGFDTRFRIAGDDVDLCWRLQEHGGTLGFSPCALVWHHRRDRVRQYLKQQYNYGRAEGMLEAKWPEKYNRIGHMRWSGRLYGKGHTPSAAPRARRVDHGVWGVRLFQSMYTSDNGLLWTLARMPEWYIVVAGLAVLVLLALSWPPLYLLAPLLLLAVVLPAVQATLGAARAQFTTRTDRSLVRMQLFLLTGALHVLQPFVRLLGRLQENLTPWRLHGTPSYAAPRAREFEHWSETWRSPTWWLESLETSLRQHRVLVRRGGNFDRWDLQANCGLFGGARMLSTIEEHGSNRQLIRVRAWPRIGVATWFLLSGCGSLTLASWLQGAQLVAVIFAALFAVVAIRTWGECSSALRSVRSEIRAWSAVTGSGPTTESD